MEGSIYCSCKADDEINNADDLTPEAVCGRGVINECPVSRLKDDHCNRKKRDLLDAEYAGFEYDDFFVADDDTAQTRYDPTSQLNVSR